VLDYLSNQISSEEEHQNAAEVFSRLDINKDGKLTEDELAKGFEEIFGTFAEQEIKEIMKKADTDGNGSIDFNEFKTLTYVKVSNEINISRLKKAFNFFDKDGSG
jgi:Ca2+-binding EF-hand superfamily protein